MTACFYYKHNLALSACVKQVSTFRHIYRAYLAYKLAWAAMKAHG